MSKANKYVLEVCKFITEKEGENGWLKLGTKIKHIGYMKAKFSTKDAAVSYYNKNNVHMRSLKSSDGEYRSDWDPDTKLLYIVRKDHMIYATVDCFSKQDNNNLIYLQDGVLKQKNYRF